MLERMRIFSGNSNKKLAEDICTKLGISLGKAGVATFSDGETRVEINENVRGMDVFIIQSTCPPVNDHVMELLILIDAMKRASADRVTAVIPYYGYARQDRKVAPRAPISAKLVADLITAAGANRVMSLDLHAGQIQGFFNIPVDNLFATPILLKYMMSNFANDLVIVSPDTGGVERARAFAKRLNATLAIIDKRREGPNVSEVMNIIGDVEGKRDPARRHDRHRGHHDPGRGRTGGRGATDVIAAAPTRCSRDRPSNGSTSRASRSSS